MSNTISADLINKLHENMNIISRELVGIVPAMTMSMNAQRAAKNQKIVSFETEAQEARDITPGADVPDNGDQTINDRGLVITKERAVDFRWDGNEQMSLDNNGAGYDPIKGDQSLQAMRTLVNEVEADAAALWTGAAGGLSYADTYPFKSNLADLANIRKALDTRGVPMTDRHLILDLSSAAHMRTLSQLSNVNQAGDSDFLRQGVLGNIFGLNIHESHAIESHVKGTVDSATTDDTGYDIGDTTITLDSAGTGTILANDTIFFDGDPNGYQVVTGDADVSGGGTVVIAAPGLLKAIPAATTAISVAPSGSRMLAYSRDAIALATRLPALPKEGDRAVDSVVITDDKSGLSFEVRMYQQYRRVFYEVGLAWGVAVMNPKHLQVFAG